jgi:glycogen debranching enzyme
VTKASPHAQPEYAIIATEASADDRTHVLKADDTFAVLDRYGDIVRGGLGQLGLYGGGTRRLSRFELAIAGHRPLLLSSTVTEDDAASIVDLTNPDVLVDGGERLHRETLHLHRSTILTPDGLYCQIRVHNYGLAPVGFDLDVVFDADFADVFEVRGKHRERRGHRSAPVTSDRALRFSYRGLDDVVRMTLVVLDPPPRAFHGTRATWRFAIASGAYADLRIAATCDPSQIPSTPFDVVRGRAANVLRERAVPLARIRTADPHLDACFRRAASDLAIMLTATPHGLYPYAGIPWFCTPFGRDGLVTAYQLLWLHPPVAAGVLRFLAATQATTLDGERDAEPGKILHETRGGEMAALGEVPFGRYYGSVDATPLFLFLAGAYQRRTGDRALVEEIWPHLTAALGWIDRWGDADGDGFLEYARRSERGLQNQGWKDSEDAVFDEAGVLVDAPIALAEVQAYTYGAKREGARLAALLGERELAARLAAEADALRARFEEAFWCEDLGTYALALDGAKRPCRVRTSNAGQCLLTGIAAGERARRVASGLLAADFFSGWGIRTVSARERRYNPISYHNGTVWPHDNSLIGAGLARYGLTAEVVPILDGLIEAARWMAHDRLPELFCGFARHPAQGPTLYPVACAPQAWAAGSLYLLLSSALGLDIAAEERRVVLTRPRLPAGLERVVISSLEVGGATLDLDIRRHAGGGVDVLPRTSGPLEVEVIAAEAPP